MSNFFGISREDLGLPSGDELKTAATEYGLIGGVVLFAIIVLAIMTAAALKKKGKG